MKRATLAGVCHFCSASLPSFTPSWQLNLAKAALKASGG